MLRKFVVASAIALASLPAFAAECAVEVNSTDQMTFETKSIDVSKSCKTFTVTLKHTGTMPKQVMGHNWVLSKTADAQAIATDGIAAGVDNDYIKAGDERVIAHTKLIGGGETATVSFDVAKLEAGTPYEFFCSFPGHIGLMKGELKLVD
ncbi:MULTISPECIES: azurin [Pseudomonas]|uniref:azurin n=1 Tax=Pseudomonas TaxID=286 RepID=UPI001C8255C2|nr:MULTISPECIES: azurin [Pseudomonas]MDG9927774.1 azurin [Pseudomonas sp. GD04042]MDH0483127.1 azurin [Pseudomonas sp. GD04015]MDH0605320.1 azurin [Pseudomonas sp. GD03869]MDH0893296.1 azurin [Pseudomonas sp. GD03875]MDH1064198.1 azurin [Pseudomonas sp. GD03985]